MLCLEMKLKSRFRGDRRHHSSSSSALLGRKEDDRSFKENVLHQPKDKGELPMHKRDRSKSLGLDYNGPLINIEGKSSGSKSPLHAELARRGSAANALSSSSDLISRRGVFSRRHYGSVEMLPQVNAEGSDLHVRRFRVENSDSHGDRDELYGSPSTPVLENPEYQTRWYFKYFLGKLHQNYVGCDSERNSFFLSVVLTDANNQRVPQYRAILWRKTGAQKISLCYMPSKPMTVKQILSNFSSIDRIEKGPKDIFTPEIQKDLLLLEEQEGSVNFKFGILFMKAGQTSDDEILSNERGSKHFASFLRLLGDKIRLKGWDKFRGGLDVKGDMTGSHSIYTIYEGHEIMFHVSTLLPFSADNKQQVERKRHIGNDIVNIVFLDGGHEEMSQFSPSYIKSQFTHIFALVTHSSDDNSYKLQVYSEETVPLFGPSLPSPALFQICEEFREFLLVKLINGEKATFNTPTFSQKRERTLDMLIRDIYQEHIPDNRGTMLNRRAFSDVLPDPPKATRRKEEARQVEFVRFGQALKLDTIVRGDAPTSLATTGLFKHTPWEPQCCYPDFPLEIVSGDSWGVSRIFLATTEGVFIVEEGVQHRLVFDRSIFVKQLSVVEAHGILLLRNDKGREGKIYVFRLSDFETEAGVDERPRTKYDIKDHRLEKSRGCHLFALSRPGGSHLRMVVAIGKKLFIFQWKHSAAWTAWCPGSDTDTVEGFIAIKEISLPEVPSLITLIDSPSINVGGGATDNRICIGYKNHWDLTSEKTQETARLYTVESSKVNLVAAIDIFEDDEAELLLCFNNSCHFQKLNANDTSNEFDFQWNSVPSAIVCAFPYIMAFTHDSIEIRLVINGNLVQTMVMPNLKFLTSKSDIFFATTAPEFFSTRHDPGKGDRLEREPSLSPPSSPQSNYSSGDRASSTERESPVGLHGSNHNGNPKPFRIYRIPFSSLTGIGSCDRRCPTPSAPVHPPVIAPVDEFESGHEKHTCLEKLIETDVGGNPKFSSGKPDRISGGMHLQVKELPYLSRSCSTSPTHNVGAVSHFPGGGAVPGGSPFLGKKSVSQIKQPNKQRNRTNSLTVEMGGYLTRQSQPLLNKYQLFKKH